MGRSEGKGGSMRMRRSVALAVGLILASGVASAIAQRAEAPTSLEFVDFADSDGDAMSDYIIGTVFSPKRKCEGGRTVRITRRFPTAGEPRLIDTTRTSTNGYWAGGGVEEINSIDGRVSVARKVIRRRGGRLTCKPTGENFD